MEIASSFSATKPVYRVGESNSALGALKIFFHDYQYFIRAILRGNSVF